MNWLILWPKDFENLYAGALRQLTTGRMGWSGLCNLIKPFMIGAEWFNFMSFHFELGGMRLGLWFIVFLIWFWKLLVGLDVEIWKFFLSMKSCILVSYWCVVKMTKEFPLSAEAIMASLALSLDCIDFKALSSGCVFL
jgi:hypothetical protein